jgi:hypothetical protein
MRPLHISHINNAEQVSVVPGYPFYQLLKLLGLVWFDFVDADFHKGFGLFVHGGTAFILQGF